MGLCAFSMEKESLLITHQYLKISGVKLKTNSMIYEMNIFRNINYLKDYLIDTPISLNIPNASETPMPYQMQLLFCMIQYYKDFENIGV